MKLRVRYKGSPDCPVIGTLADDARGRVYFQYDGDWITKGIELSPIHLPLSRDAAVTTPHEHFSPLFGLFDDSLPDWWGQRVMRRHFESMNLRWNEVTPLEKLACQGHFALGALAYEPDLSKPSFRETIGTTVTELVESARLLMHGDAEEILPALIRGGLSPGGAQPKAVLAFKQDRSEVVAGGAPPPPGFDRWLVKFQIDAEEPVGREEHAINRMAAAAGIRVPSTDLYETADGAAHYMAKRFDHQDGAALHFHSVAGLTHTPVRDLIDYRDLMDLTRDLTRKEQEIEEMFRRAIFNIAIANDDDHSRNHAFLLSSGNEWELSPAYDLTRSAYALGSGHRACGVRGRFTGVQIADLKALGHEQSLRKVDDQIERVLSALRQWPEFASQAGLTSGHSRVLGSEMPGLSW